jgi:hypothetical protein
MKKFLVATVEQVLAYLGYRDFADDNEDWQKLDDQERMYFRLEVGKELAGRKLLPAPQS